VAVRVTRLTVHFQRALLPTVPRKLAENLTKREAARCVHRLVCRACRAIASGRVTLLSACGDGTVGEKTMCSALGPASLLRLSGSVRARFAQRW